jgi:hypothetical protein
VCFYLDAFEGVSIHVADHAMATTFQPGEVITLESGGMKMRLILSIEEGHGQFFGHIAKGNRPSQKHVTGDGRFKSYDWHVFLRTIQRDAQCKVRVSLRFNHGGTA